MQVITRGLVGHGGGHARCRGGVGESRRSGCGVMMSLTRVSHPLQGKLEWGLPWRGACALWPGVLQAHAHAPVGRGWGTWRLHTQTLARVHTHPHPHPHPHPHTRTHTHAPTHTHSLMHAHTHTHTCVPAQRVQRVIKHTAPPGQPRGTRAPPVEVAVQLLRGRGAWLGRAATQPSPLHLLRLGRHPRGRGCSAHARARHSVGGSALSHCHPTATAEPSIPTHLLRGRGAVTQSASDQECNQLWSRWLVQLGSIPGATSTLIITCT